MPPQLELKLLGKPQVHIDGEAVTGFHTTKIAALLYYLAVTGRPSSREVLADLLWNDMDEAKAKRNLTQALSHLRRQFEPYLEVGSKSVGLNSELVWLDVVEFQQLVEGDAVDEAFTHLRQAVALYRGRFLEDFNVRGAYPFEEWALTQQERLRELMIQVLERLVIEALNRAEYDTGLDYADRLLKLEPWQETAHCQMMILLARSGQRNRALAQYETCRQILADELGVEPMAETTELYNRLLTADTPPPHNLPTTPNPFVGRKNELAYIIRTLANDPSCRLMTIVGPGGIGKTRLALETAGYLITSEAVLDRMAFKDGVYFVNLAAASSSGPDAANILTSAVVTALNLSFHGSGDLRAQLLDYLQGKEMLLILDNFEQLLPATHLLSTILNQGGGVKLLVTSRAQLNLVEEWALTLDGLQFPAATTVAPPEPNQTLEQYSAVDLFMQRTRQTQSRLTATETDLAAVVEICQLVEGVPLALELAASWVRVLPIEEIATEINRSLDFLETLVRNVPERHHSLRAVFEQSWQMLSLQEQNAFSKLSIFRGGFRRTAAKKVAHISLQDLTSLVDKSLLRLTASDRYEVHELLRQYAAEKLWLTTEGEAAPTSTDTLWQQYGTYYLGFIREHEDALWGLAPHEAAAEIRAELDNIRQAWQWAVGHLQLDAIADSIVGLARFYDVENLFQEGDSLFGQAIEQIEQGASEALIDQPLAQITCIKLLCERARLLTRRGLAHQAVEVAQKAADLAHNRQDQQLEAAARRQLGEARQFEGVYDLALVELEQALALAQAIPLPQVEAEALRDIAILAHYQNRWDEAEKLANEALNGFKALGDRRNEGIIYLILGGNSSGQEQYLKSEYNFGQALKIFQEFGDRWLISMAFSGLGWVNYEIGEFSAAQHSFDQALMICRERQDYITEIHTLRDLANLIRDQGSYALAQAHYENCFELRHKSGNQHIEGYALADLGLLFHYLGHHEAAQDYCRRALTFAQEVDVKAAQAFALVYLGHGLLALNQLTEAANSYQQAYDLMQILGMKQRAVMAQAGLAEIALVRGDLAQAQLIVSAMLTHLADKKTYGINELFRVFLICFRVLEAGQDPQAQTVLTQGYHLLQERVAKIEDDHLRHSFLENIPHHRALVQAYQLL